MNRLFFFFIFKSSRNYPDQVKLMLIEEWQKEGFKTLADTLRKAAEKTVERL